MLLITKIINIYSSVMLLQMIIILKSLEGIPPTEVKVVSIFASFDEQLQRPSLLQNT